MISIYEHPPESGSVLRDLHKLINSYNHWSRFYYLQVTHEETRWEVVDPGFPVTSGKSGINLHSFLLLRLCKYIEWWQPTPVFLPREVHGQGSRAGYSPWGHKESDTTVRLSLSGCCSPNKGVSQAAVFLFFFFFWYNTKMLPSVSAAKAAEAQRAESDSRNSRMAQEWLAGDFQQGLLTPKYMGESGTKPIPFLLQTHFSPFIESTALPSHPAQIQNHSSPWSPFSPHICIVITACLYLS